MGSIKKIRKKYSKPSHPWRIARIEEENALTKEYGIPRKTELWKSIARLESFKNQTKKLSALQSKQAQKEKEALTEKLLSYNLIKKGDSSDTILGITLKNMLDRRLQTIVFKKNLAKTMRQARQIITHGHILVAGKALTSPSYMVRAAEENAIEISPKSPFYYANHPERVNEGDLKKKEAKKEKKARERPRRRGDRRKR